MSRSSLDRAIKAMLTLCEDANVSSEQRTKAGAVITQLLKTKAKQQPRKRRSPELTKLLREMGVRPPKPAQLKPSA